MKLFTEIEISEIEKFKNLKGADLNKIKILLANEVTSLCHGKEKSEKVELEAKSILDSSEIDSETIDSCDQKIVIKSKAIDNGILLKQLLVQLKLSQSNGQSKRLIEQGAVKINEKVVKEKDMNISSKHFIKHPQKKNCHYLVLYVGKKNYGVVELIS